MHSLRAARRHAAVLFRRTASSDAQFLMPLYFSPNYLQPLPERHPFPMERYQAVQDAVAARLRGPNPSPLAVVPVPQPVSREELALAHSEAYITQYVANRLDAVATRAIGFPWSPGFVERTLSIVGGTLAATRNVLCGRGQTHDQTATSRPIPVAANAAGGTHHAFRDRGEGYCIFNDLAVAAKLALENGWAQAVCVIDLDVHQGNGTAAILAGDDRVFTFSMHGERNYPWRTRQPSSLDVGLNDGCDGSVYLPALAKALDTVTSRFVGPCREAGHTVLCLYQAGVDCLRGDRWGRLALSREDLMARNTQVLDYCARHELPLVITMGGGYGKPIERSAEAHADLFCQAAEFTGWKRRAD